MLLKRCCFACGIAGADPDKNAAWNLLFLYFRLLLCSVLFSGERTTVTKTALLITTTACAAATNTPVAATVVALIVEHTFVALAESAKAA